MSGKNNNTEKLIATIRNSTRSKIDVVAVGRQIDKDTFSPRAVRIRLWTLYRDAPNVIDISIKRSELADVIHALATVQNMQEEIENVVENDVAATTETRPVPTRRAA